MSKIKEVFFEEHRNLELLPKDRCYIDDNMCSTTIANRTVEDSYGAGLIYYDPELNDNFMIGILKSRFLEKATNTYIVNYFRMRDFADWILAHTADDTVRISFPSFEIIFILLFISS